MAVEVPLSKEAEQALVKYPEITRMLEQFVREQAEYSAWREAQNTPSKKKARALVARGRERARKRREAGEVDHAADVRRIMEIREKAAEHFLKEENA